MKHLMKECYGKSRKALEATNNQHEDKNVEKLRNHGTTTNDEIMDRPVREEARTMDAIESENGYSCEKSVENYELKYKEARNVFPNGLSAAVLKCSTGLNMHEKMECQINELVKDDSCPRCSELEHYNHVIQCGCVESKRNECLGKLREKLDKEESKNACQLKINAIIVDIQKFLNKESDYQTNQELIGLRNVFRGMAVQFWIGGAFNNNDDRK